MSTRSCPFCFKAEVSVLIGGWPRGFSYCFVDDGAQRRQGADGIGIGGIACQCKCLAAASSEIDLLPRTRPTRFLHPRVPAKRLERRRFLPDPAKRLIPNAVEA